MGEFALKNEDVIKGRKKYQEFLNKRKMLYEKKQRMFELEKNPLVQEYLELKRDISNEKKFRMDDIFPSYVEKIDSNSIYILKNKFNGVIEYVDIETSFSTLIPLKEQKEFEKNHTVLGFQDPNEMYEHFCKLLLTIKEKDGSTIQKEAMRRLINKVTVL